MLLVREQLVLMMCTLCTLESEGGSYQRCSGFLCNTCLFCFFRTVEINNTDAEGRLVLGDGVCSSLYVFCTVWFDMYPGIFYHTDLFMFTCASFHNCIQWTCVMFIAKIQACMYAHIWPHTHTEAVVSIASHFTV